MHDEIGFTIEYRPMVLFVRLGDCMNGFVESTSVGTLQEAADWLVDAAERHYPIDQQKLEEEVGREYGVNFKKWAESTGFYSMPFADRVKLIQGRLGAPLSLRQPHDREQETP